MQSHHTLKINFLISVTRTHLNVISWFICGSKVVFHFNPTLCCACGSSRSFNISLVVSIFQFHEIIKFQKGNNVLLKELLNNVNTSLMASSIVLELLKNIPYNISGFFILDIIPIECINLLFGPNRWGNCFPILARF